MNDRKGIQVKIETALKLEKYIQAHPLRPKIIHIVDAALDEYYANHPIKEGGK